MAIFGEKYSEEEAKKLAEEMKLNKEELEGVNGGYVYWDVDKWLVVNDETGRTMDIIHPQKRGKKGVEEAREAAQARAIELGQSPDKITGDELDRLRG